MKTFIAEFRGAVMATLVLVIVSCGVYPLVVFGVGQALFRHKANGSLIVDKQGIVRGSELLGQAFSGEKYFHSRASSAGQGYDAANSSGSNLGPTSQKLNDAVKDRVVAYRKENGLSEAEPVPADAVTASGSGLDPHISVRNAEIQATRVAKARNIDVEKVRKLIHAHTDPRSLGIMGEPGVNILKLNLALDNS